jgi:hypothetical protein
VPGITLNVGYRTDRQEIGRGRYDLHQTGVESHSWNPLSLIQMEASAVLMTPGGSGLLSKRSAI